MQAFLTEYLNLAPGLFIVQLFAYLSLLVSWPLFLLLEKFTPVQKNTPISNYWLNWRITASNFFLAPVFSTAVVIGTASLVSNVGYLGLKVPSADVSVGIPVVDIFMQGTIIFLTACFIGDFAYYWWHRAQHTFPFLWEMHKLHHSDENLNTTTIYRSHFLESAGQSLFRGIIIGLIFAPAESQEGLFALIFGSVLLLLWDYFIHANVRIDFLNRLLPFFSTPQLHWIHHSKLPQHQDKNFAIWLPVFDVVFGSYYRPAVDEYPPTGLASGEKIETVWEGQTGPLVVWAKSLRNLFSGKGKATGESEES